MPVMPQMDRVCAAWRRPARIACVGALLAQIALLSGCHYGTNRLADLMDIFQAGAGFTTENPRSGILPPSIGLYAQASDFLCFGATYFNGVSAELDGRGLFAGPEERFKYGLLWLQGAKIDQDYYAGRANYFKKPGTLWTQRMSSRPMRWMNAPAKELQYENYADYVHQGFPLFPRGWQYWELIGVEIGMAGICCSHLGFNLRLGIDVSEISDFLLGFTTFDFKKDDLDDEEFAEKRGA